MLPANFDRPGADLVGRKHSRDRRRSIRNNQSKIALLSFLGAFAVPSLLMSQKTAAHLKPRGAQIEPATCRNGFFKSAQQSREIRASDSCTAQPDRSRL